MASTTKIKHIASHNCHKVCNTDAVNDVASQFLRSIRGRRSQVAFSRKLGYRGNPVSDWENGRRYPSAREALRASEIAGIDVAAAIERFAPSQPLTRDPAGFDLARWLDHLRGTRSIGELALQANRSRFAISRYLSGRAHPRLPTFFLLVDVITARLPELIAELVPISSVPSQLARYKRMQAARSAAFCEPWTEAVLRVIETPGYQSMVPHTAESLGRVLGIDEERVRRCLQLLTRAGILRKRGGRYCTAGTLTVDTRAGPEALAGLRTHWAEVGRQRAGRRRDGDYFAYNVVSVAAQDLNRARGILRGAYNEIRSIVAASEPADTVALLLMQIVSWGQPGKDSPDL